LWHSILTYFFRVVCKVVKTTNSFVMSVSLSDCMAQLGFNWVSRKSQ
jgi:hypothetical protein